MLHARGKHRRIDFFYGSCYITPVMCEDIQGKVLYRCVRCGACCRWEGNVCVEPEEIEAIAGFLGMDEDFFIEQYCQLRENRQGLSLKDGPDGACIMLEHNDCKINPVKPVQCRNFPNGWNFPGWRDRCRAVPDERSRENNEP